MKKVLLVDTSFAARPIYDWLVSSDFDVWVVGNRPEDPLCQMNADRYVNCSYSDVDYLRHWVKSHHIDFVVPGCTDVSMDSAIRIGGSKSQFDEIEKYNTLTNKAAFRDFCSSFNLPSPRRIIESELPVCGNVIVKPVDSFSGRGISILDGNDLGNISDAVEVAKKESSVGGVVLENCVSGQLYSISCFIREGIVSEHNFVIEHGSTSQFSVDTSYVVNNLSVFAVKSIINSVNFIVKELKLIDGLMHVQFICNDDEVWIIEVTRRCPGDLYPRLIQLSTGLPHAAIYASFFVRRPEIRFSNFNVDSYILRHTVTASHKVYPGIVYSQPEPILEFYPTRQIGRIAPDTKVIDRVAVSFMKYSDGEQLKMACGRFLDRNSYMCAPR